MTSAFLVFQDDRSNKFWNIETNGTTLTTHWGRIGTAGQYNVKQLYDKSRCEREALKLIAAKTKKGYVEAITEQLIMDAFITIFSGIALRHPVNENEFYYRSDKFNKLATIEFVDGAEHIIFRHYYEGGQIKSEHEWLSGKQHGRDIGWYEDGQKHWERQFDQGRLIKEERYWAGMKTTKIV